MPQFPAGKTADQISAGTADAVAMNADAAIITTKSLTTAGAFGSYTFTVNCSQLKLTSIPVVEMGLGSNSQGIPIITTMTVAATQDGPGTLTIVIVNAHATLALNGTLLLYVLLIN
jgi:hypothetical protein